MPSNIIKIHIEPTWTKSVIYQSEGIFCLLMWRWWVDDKALTWMITQRSADWARESWSAWASEAHPSFGSSRACGVWVRVDLTCRFASGMWERLWRRFASGLASGASSHRYEHVAIRNWFGALLQRFKTRLWQLKVRFDSSEIWRVQIDLRSSRTRLRDLIRHYRRLARLLRWSTRVVCRVWWLGKRQGGFD